MTPSIRAPRYSFGPSTVIVNRYLSENGSEEDTLSIDYEIPKSHVNGVRAGQRVAILATHLGNMDAPTYTAWRWVRVIRRQVKQIVTTPDEKSSFSVSTSEVTLVISRPTGLRSK